MKRRMRSEEGWELSPAESLGWLSQKCCWEGRWRERLERLCYSIPHPVLATQWQQSKHAESCIWREREMARKSCLLRSQDDRETVRKPMGSEKASSRFSESDSEGRLPAPGGSPGSCMGSSKPAVSASFLCGAGPQPWNRDLPTSVNPVH